MKLWITAFMFSFAVATVPAEVFKWATGPNATNIRPIDSRISNGWFPGEKPAAQHFNYLFHSIGDWIEYLNEGYGLQALPGPVVLSGLVVSSNDTNKVAVTAGAALINGKTYWLSNTVTNTVLLPSSGGSRNRAVVCITTNGITIVYGETNLVPDFGDGRSVEPPANYRPLAELGLSTTSVASVTPVPGKGVWVHEKTKAKPTWFYTLSAALNYVPNFSSVYVLPGQYFENIVLSNKMAVSVVANEAASFFAGTETNRLLSILGCELIDIRGGWFGFRTNTSASTGILVSGSRSVRLDGFTITNTHPSTPLTFTNSTNVQLFNSKIIHIQPNYSPVLFDTCVDARVSGHSYNSKGQADATVGRSFYRTNITIGDAYDLLSPFMPMVNVDYKISGGYTATNSSVYGGVSGQFLGIYRDSTRTNLVVTRTYLRYYVGAGLSSTTIINNWNSGNTNLISGNDQFQRVWLSW